MAFGHRTLGKYRQLVSENDTIPKVGSSALCVLSSCKCLILDNKSCLGRRISASMSLKTRKFAPCEWSLRPLGIVEHEKCGRANFRDGIQFHSMVAKFLFPFVCSLEGINIEFFHFEKRFGHPCDFLFVFFLK